MNTGPPNEEKPLLAILIEQMIASRGSQGSPKRVQEVPEIMNVPAEPEVVEAKKSFSKKERATELVSGECGGESSLSD